MSELPPFNPLARCPKCLYDCVSTTYNDGLDHYRNWASHEQLAKRAKIVQQYHDHAQEHLARKCIRCGWKWSEACEPESLTNAP